MAHHAERLARIMPLMHHIVSHLGVQSTPSGKRLGLTNTRMMALAAVMHGDGLAMSDLAAVLDFPAPLATRTVDELVERGLLVRASDPSDRRRVLVRATPAAPKAFDEVHRDAALLIGHVLERMTDEEADALVVGLEALSRAMHAPGGPLAPHDHP
ncbi:MAG TPA: MarR family transcriptional regulator [Coriobacteriia bacterium]|nr:MarR family transcriptional regulator [Coriobacteriia bacterium]